MNELLKFKRFAAMATERQIAANRANAKRSTGPKTAAGRLKSSRNAYRYGLSGPLRLDAETSSKVEAITRALAGEGASVEQLSVAAGFAQAQSELLQIRRIRAQMMSEVDFNFNDTQELRRLVALDRYERFAHTKRRRASFKL